MIPLLILKEMFAKLTRERETETLIAALTHQRFKKPGAGVAELQLQPAISISHSLSLRLPPESFNGVIALNSTVNLSPMAYGSN